ncbi:hypothetical protein NDU88_001991 [Pleurodeles waltl]|uniref:Uncharacterized protein n=1 Tax=Pleurodeles waltl TaxID=8319 RepID=A0AAV7W1X9_PLEWA|nr:hypothetical protein NDU88_001991 [Pleurodeles waltl]
MYLAQGQLELPHMGKQYGSHPRCRHVLERGVKCTREAVTRKQRWSCRACAKRGSGEDKAMELATNRGTSEIATRLAFIKRTRYTNKVVDREEEKREGRRENTGEREAEGATEDAKFKVEDAKGEAEESDAVGEERDEGGEAEDAEGKVEEKDA